MIARPNGTACRRRRSCSRQARGRGHQNARVLALLRPEVDPGGGLPPVRCTAVLRIATLVVDERQVGDPAAPRLICLARTDTLSTYRLFSLSARTRVSLVASRPARLNLRQFGRRSNCETASGLLLEGEPDVALRKEPAERILRRDRAARRPARNLAIRAVPPSTGLLQWTGVSADVEVDGGGIFRAGSMSTEVSVLMIPAQVRGYDYGSARLG